MYACLQNPEPAIILKLDLLFCMNLQLWAGQLMKNKGLFWQEGAADEPLYLRVYGYYKELIRSGRLPAGARLPSIRRCAQELEVSRTTVEAAYAQLAAEGYVSARPQSGFYAASLEYDPEEAGLRPALQSAPEKPAIRFDFASASVDAESFDFALWRRYIKSALRADQRLLSYGEPQGEPDLRAAICGYVAQSRNVVCSPEQIVIGAGVQSLLHILCALLGGCPVAGFWNNSFAQGQAVLEDHGFSIRHYRQETDDFSALERDGVRLLYLSPSHMDAMGSVMPVAQRLKLLEAARRAGCLVVEDDYDSEFRYFTHPVPSLQGLDGGRSVLYMGTFSKLLLPSLRLSFMALPSSLMEAYKQRGGLYNQTASKAEQIALCQFIRDGHLAAQIRKSRKLYMGKSRALCEAAGLAFGPQARAEVCASGLMVRLTLPGGEPAPALQKRAQQAGIAVRVEGAAGNGNASLLLASTGVPADSFREAMRALQAAICGTPN